MIFISITTVFESPKNDYCINTINILITTLQHFVSPVNITADTIANEFNHSNLSLTRI